MQTHFTQSVIALARGITGTYSKDEEEEEEEADKPKT